MAILAQSTAYTRMFLMVLASDHVSPATGLTVVVNLSKAGAAFGAAAGTVTEVANGWYKVALTTADTGTLGDLAYHCTSATADNTDFVDQVGPPPVNVVQALGNAVTTATNGILDVNTKNINNVAAATPGASGGMVINGANSGSITLADVTVTGTAASGATPAKNALTLTGGAASTTGGGTAGAGLSVTGGAGAASGNGAAAGATIVAGGTTTVSGNDGMQVAGSSAGAGVKSTGGATGPGAKLVGGATSGDGLDVVTTSGDGINSSPTAGHGMNLSGQGTSKHGLVSTGGTAGTSDGIKGAAGTGGVDIRGNITGNVTGNLSGSAGSVTGAVGSVTGAVGSVTGAVGSVTAGVTVATNNDKTGYTLTVTPPTAATIATTIWTDLMASSDFSTASSIGALLKADINAPIGSIPTTTPLTAAQIATGIFQDTTAGDFTVAGSIGKSLAPATLGTVPGAAGGLFIAGTNAATTITTGLTTTFTGNLTGSVGSVTGAVGSVTGAVGSVAGNVGGNVGGNVVGSVGSVVATVAANLTQILGTALTETAGQLAAGFKKFFNVGSPTSTMNEITLVDTTTAVTNAIVLPTIPANWITAAGINASALNGKGDWLLASSYTAPDNADIASIVTTLGVAGAGLTALGDARLNDLDAAVSSRAPASTALSTAQWTNGRATNLDDLDAAVSSRLATSGYTAPPTAAANATATMATAVPGAFSAGTAGYVIGHLGAAADPWATDVPGSYPAGSAGNVLGNLGASGGSGAYAVAITVTDGTNPLVGARVRVTSGISSFVQTTDGSGVASFSLDAATWTVSITDAGYQFTPASLVVAANASQTYAMTQVAITPSAVGQVTGYMYCYDSGGNIEPGVSISIAIAGFGTATGLAYDEDVRTGTSDVNGLVQFPGMWQGATYEVYRGRATSNAIAVVVPKYAGTSTPPPFRLPSLMGEP